MSRDSGVLTHSPLGSVRRVRVLRMFVDYGHQWPLWETGSDKYTMEPADYDLSEELTGELRLWWDDWDINGSHPDHGWPSEEHSKRWFNTGFSLARQLAAEVGPDVTVEYAGNLLD